MNSIKKRLEGLEARVAPVGKNVLIIKHNKDESDTEVMARTGITPEDLKGATTVIRVKGV